MNTKKLIIKNTETGNYMKGYTTEEGFQWTTNLKEAQTFTDAGQLSYYQSIIAPIRLSGIDLHHPRIKALLEKGVTL